MFLKTESIPSFRCSVCTLFLTHLVKGAHPNRNKRGRDDSKKEVIQIRKLIENHVCEEPVLVVIKVFEYNCCTVLDEQPIRTSYPKPTEF